VDESACGENYDQLDGAVGGTPRYNSCLMG
jgi:hypothetical protein